MKELRQYWTVKNPNRPTTKYIVIHHAAFTYKKGDAVRSIYEYHKGKWGPQGYSGAGYNIICQEELDGSIQCYLVNPPDMQGAGVMNRNHECFHICLATNFAKNIPEQKWINAAREAYAYAIEKYPNAELVGHKDIALPVSPTSCPGGKWPLWKKDITESIPMVNTNGVAIQRNVFQNIDVLRDILFRRGVDINKIVPIVSAYTAYGELTKMGNVYPLAQAIHETGWFKSPRFIQSNNVAGIGATDDGKWGNIFNSISEGVFAQYAHLLVYSTKPEQNSYFLEQMAHLSPRYSAAVNAYGRGSALTWRELSGKWATDTNYGNKILEIGATLL